MELKNKKTGGGKKAKTINTKQTRLTFEVLCILEHTTIGMLNLEIKLDGF